MAGKLQSIGMVYLHAYDSLRYVSWDNFSILFLLTMKCFIRLWYMEYDYNYHSYPFPCILKPIANWKQISKVKPCFEHD